jgi:hypothetical protein
MGTIPLDPDQGAYGEFDANPGVNSDADNVLAIMEMNREAEIADAERDRKLDIKGIAPPEEDDDLIDFSNPTKDEGSDLLEANFSDYLKDIDYQKALDKLSGGGKGFEPEALGESGSIGSPGKNVAGARGFSEMESPYAAPKYYSPQGSVLYQNMTRDLIKGLLANTIRKPSIRSLV